MITTNSRYANDQLVLVEGSDGKQRTTIILPEPTSNQFTYTTHVVTAIDRLDLLATTYLGDPSQWWKICDLNPDITIDWTVMPVGKTIRVPTS